MEAKCSQKDKELQLMTRALEEAKTKAASMPKMILDPKTQQEASGKKET